MLKICITNFTVESITNLGSVNIGKTIISQNRSNLSTVPLPSPSVVQEIPGQPQAVPGQQLVPAKPVEIIPPVPPVTAGEVRDDGSNGL